MRTGHRKSCVFEAHVSNEEANSVRQCQLRCFQPIRYHKVLLPVQTKRSYRSRQEKSVASVFCSKSKENAFFLKTVRVMVRILRLLFVFFFLFLFFFFQGFMPGFYTPSVSVYKGK